MFIVSLTFQKSPLYIHEASPGKLLVSYLEQSRGRYVNPSYQNNFQLGNENTAAKVWKKLMCMKIIYTIYNYIL